MTILVSGASGFLGSKLIKQLSKGDEKVIALSRSTPKDVLSDLQNIEWIQADLSNPKLSLNFLPKIDTVIHLAGATLGAGKDEDIFFKANEAITFNLLNHFSNKCSKFIYSSSQVVYGNPCKLKVDEDFALDGLQSAYACSKVNCENWLKWFQKKTKGSYISLRFCGFIDGGGLTDYIIQNAIKDNNIQLFSKGNIIRDYLPSSDGIQAMQNSIKNIDKFYNRYLPINIGSAQQISAKQISKLVINALDSKSKIILLDREGPQGDFLYNISKAKNYINFIPSNLENEIIKYALNRKEKNAK
jgi:nucleoside-diphosphate-sugar epimerase